MCHFKHPSSKKNSAVVMNIVTYGKTILRCDYMKMGETGVSLNVGGKTTFASCLGTCTKIIRHMWYV